jgi:GNAT superfamily N-acetyltransferase
VTESAPLLRRATLADVPAIDALIDRSVRALSAGYYTPAQIESALRHVFGTDTQLVRDGTYFVVEIDGALAAAGGWSGRRTLFGGDRMADRVDDALDPAREPARIRAFYVDPGFARRGLGRLLFAACHAAARDAGFTTLELMATLPGEPLYAALGFTVEERIVVPLPDGVSLPGARMRRPV